MSSREDYLKGCDRSNCSAKLFQRAAGSDQLRKLLSEIGLPAPMLLDDRGRSPIDKGGICQLPPDGAKLFLQLCDFFLEAFSLSPLIASFQ